MILGLHFNSDKMRKSILLLFLFTVAFQSSATTYYVDSKIGSDSYKGISTAKPFRSLERLRLLKLMAGDSILLHTGSVHEGGVSLVHATGSVDEPIVISAYDTEAGRRRVAHIDAKNQLAGLLLENCRYISVSRLQITAAGGEVDEATRKSAMRCGVLVRTTQLGEYGNIALEQLHIKDVFYNPLGVKRSKSEVRSANGTQAYGWGIRFINSIEGTTLNHLSVKQCTIENVAHTGIKLTGKKHSINHFTVADNRVTRTGGPGMQMSGVVAGHVYQNQVSYSGSEDDTRKWGRGSGLWTWGSKDVLIEKNSFLYSNGPGDSAGAHIDFNCSDIVVQYNLSAYNAGGFCEILGDNYNCAYRYNVSVNDGFRKKGEGGAFQEGKTLWTSGYVGGKRRSGPFNSYVYNNTIYVSDAQTARVAIGNTSDGLLIANNIFYLAGDIKEVLGDQYNPEKKSAQQAKNIVFRNNLFLSCDKWKEAIPVQDEIPLIGDPNFMDAGGLSLMDYIPQNVALVKDKGVVIPFLPKDMKGVRGGLNLPCDILGNKIEGLPDVGAIEL